MMRLGSAVHVKGLGLTLVSARKPFDGGLEIDERSEHPRFNRRWLRLAKKPSTALTQEADFGL